MTRRIQIRPNKIKTCLAAAFLLTLTACGGGGGGSDSDDESNDTSANDTGADVTANPATNPTTPSGVSLRGTTSSDRQFATTEITARAQSGEVTTTTFNERGQFSFENLLGTGPWILRADLGNENFMYGISADDVANSIVQNIHSYTDAIARNWYALQGINIDTLFETVGAIADTPTTAELFAIQEGLTSVVTDVQEAYNLQNTDLSTVEYVANGAGVDEFLMENPILQDGNNITIIIFDPSTDTQSVAASDIDLSTDLTLADTTAPDAPQTVRALPSATDEITVVWDVASDNVGIARYLILRDGEEIETSPFPVFVDGGLATGTDFTYTIVAIDGAGNESPESTAVSSETLAELDTTPPAAPGALSISAGTGSLDISWTQTGVNDVASFAIRRGLNATTLTDVGNVTSTFYFDTAVDAGIEYCYEVQAVDGSGNLSTPTPVTCETASGAVVTTAQPQAPVAEIPVITAPNVASNLSAPLVDVSGLACTEELPSLIAVDTTLAAGCYLASDTVSVLGEITLTLMPGVVIKFETGTGLNIGTRLDEVNIPTLKAEGTQANPIVFSGMESTPGFWRGITFTNSTSNTLDHVQVEFAGGTSGDNGGLRVERPISTSISSISNSTFRMNNGPGIVLPADLALYSLDSNLYIDNTVSVRVTAENVALLDDESSYVGNEVDAIEVIDSDIKATTTWKNLGVPYHSEDINVEQSFEIEAGTTVLFDQGASLEAFDDGVITMLGTMEEPILLSAISGRTGGWGGLAFDSSQIENRLSYVTIDRASSESTSNAAAIAATSRFRMPTRIALDNVTIQNSSTFGMSTDEGTLITDFTNVTITGNEGLAVVGLATAQVFNNPGNFTGNSEDVIVVRSGTVEQEITYSNIDLSYNMGSTTVNDNFTLDPGVTLTMRESAFFEISLRGSALTAIGTAALPISIVGERRLPGFWNGLHFSNSTSALNQLSHVLVADGGDGLRGIANSASNIRFTCAFGFVTRVNIANSRIENSAGVGLFVPEDRDCQITVDENTTFIGNAGGDTN